MFLSVFDIFKIGVGPSSSHTMGPMTAASYFLENLAECQNKNDDFIGKDNLQIKVILHGSLAFTGKGHATDRASILGLLGQKPETIDLDASEILLEELRQNKIITVQGKTYRFDPEQDVIFDYVNLLPYHTNGMSFVIYGQEGREIFKKQYYSVGGGFVVRAEEVENSNRKEQAEQGQNNSVKAVPYPFANAKEMLEMAKKSGLSIAQMKRANEEQFLAPSEVDRQLDHIWQIMDLCIERGLKQEGLLPGGLKVQRRARNLHEKLQQEWQRNRENPFSANDWLSLFALAVNEENAAGGRIVTAPTNGAAGVIPAVIKYYLRFHGQENKEANQEAIRNFLLAAAAIGGLIKTNASISGAEVGCQGEVGSASSMAAAGLVEALHGTPEQVENAAEIALEHHLGLTCDPIAGLVQIPCIERNAFGAVKAVTAASLAMHGDGQHFVPLDACIETMRQTGIDMESRYKETSQGGLAVNVPAC